MTFLDKLDVSGQQYRISTSIPMGTCATPAGTEVKECAFADNFQLSAGNLIAVTFTYANTYGDGSTTYPKLLVQGVQYPVKIPTGAYAGDGAWVNGQAITFMFDGTNLLMTTTPVTGVVASGNMYSVTSNAVAEAFEWELISSDDVTFTIDTNGSSSTAFTPVYRHIYKCKNLIKMALAVTTTEAIPAPVGNGNMRFYVQINSIVPTSNLSTISTLGYINDAVVPISVIYNSSISPNGWRVTFRYNEALDSGVTFGFYTIIAI